MRPPFEDGPQPLPGMSFDEMVGATPDEDAERLAREVRLWAAGKSSQAAGKSSWADAEREMDELRRQLTEGPRTVNDRVRLRASIRGLYGGAWAELAMQIRLGESLPWMYVIAKDHPLLLARHGQKNEEHIVRAVKRFLMIDTGILRYSLSEFEMRVGQGQTEYRAWLTMQSRAGVAVRTREDGMLNVYGL